MAFCAGAARANPTPLWGWEQPRGYEIAVLATATALIWVDVAQTIDGTRRGWSEQNRFLGPHPTTARVIMVGGVLPTIAMTAIWYALPSGWRNVPIGGVIGGEAYAVTMNFADGLMIHF